MYAKKNHDDGIADRYEAIFAHVKRDDPRLLEARIEDLIRQLRGAVKE